MSQMKVSLLAAIIICAILGCSDGNPRTYEVKGFVRFPDGVPLASGTIEFRALDHEQPITAVGDIDENGAFTLGTFSADDGAVEGRHQVIVISSQEIGTGAERPGMIERSKLHIRFADYDTSGLEVQVKAEDNEIDIPVEYAPTGRRSRP